MVNILLHGWYTKTIVFFQKDKAHKITNTSYIIIIVLSKTETEVSAEKVSSRTDIFTDRIYVHKKCPHRL